MHQQDVVCENKDLKVLHDKILNNSAKNTNIVTACHNYFYIVSYTCVCMTKVLGL